MAENWWDEEAKRLDLMSNIVRQKGYLVSVGDSTTPELNEDGSEKTGLEKVAAKLKKKKKHAKRKGIS